MNRCIRSTLLLALLAGLSLASPAFAQDATPPASAAAAEADDFDVAEADADAIDSANPADAVADPAAAVATATPGAAAVAGKPAMKPAPADPSLLPVYKDFGELPGLTALMDDLMIGLLADARMRPFFENADQKAIKAHLVEQFCVILGGPCTYTGRDMVAAHTGLEINRSNFNALVEVLQVAMAKHKIPFRSQNRLLAKLAPMHREIETK
jgi:hemoglobin